MPNSCEFICSKSVKNPESLIENFQDFFLLFFEIKFINKKDFKKNIANSLFVRKISYLSCMNGKKDINKMKSEPTKSELEILQVLWKHGPQTVRFVNDKLNEQKRAVQYTSTLKLMQIMAEKEILKRDETNMKHIYSPALEERKTKSLLLDRFVDSMFEGSASNLMMQLFGNKKASKKELEAIKELLNKIDKK